MILTLTLNPAIDVTLSTDRIVYDDRGYISAEDEHPGGKGINATQVIHAYGGNVHAISTRGGARGRRFAQLLEEAHPPATLIEVQAETRRNFAVNDKQGLTIKLDHIGGGLRPPELEEIENALRARLPEAEWLMLTGSRPPGVPADYYARMIELAREHGVPALLDSSGEALELGLAARPAIAKPNRPEAERLLDTSLLSEAQSAAAASEIRGMGAERVILSLGSQGAVCAWEEGLLRAIPPTVETGCAIGSGDVLSATCLWALSRGETFPEAFRWAVAAASAASSKPGLSFAPLEEAESMLRRVELRPI